MTDPWTTPVPIAGRLVRLEPLGPEHAEGLAAAGDDPAVFEHLRRWDVMSPEVAAAHIARAVADPALVPWAQIDAHTGEVAGTTSYYDVDAELRTVAIGHTWIGRRFWRTGLNTEAKLLLLTRAFDELGCVRVVWHTDIRNDRSQAAIARLGAQREGVLRKHKLRDDGSWRDTVTYSMLDDEWPAARDRLTARLAADAG
ncbi:GNAT family N-acetyltransferase [Aeromicrobium tamlense]|uniref:GNAT family N-acetyltransferase n=1 Tax=Aeromicrobium tamlense TaxID=375541 RepID=A0A8I0FWD4_9ACTN|nr:GNAT family protein [Aeromicrobium tamlense]MBD1270181.1 GNAT family N-acetyltransferase [Aeromicrobium tamlense]NYI39162.1 RimJ/RimL family protein N-acetyltransferase [Aeromicrobium tamlense]